MNKYKASWDSGMFVAGKNKVDDKGYFHNYVCEMDFTDYLGYSQEDIVSIRALNVGEIWISPTHGDAHIIERTS